LENIKQMPLNNSFLTPFIEIFKSTKAWSQSLQFATGFVDTTSSPNEVLFSQRGYFQAKMQGNCHHA
jgi:hypothetical protein